MVSASFAGTTVRTNYTNLQHMEFVVSKYSILRSMLVDYETPVPCLELSTKHEEIFESEAASQNRT